MSELGDALLGVYAGRRDVYGRQKVITTLNAETGTAQRDATWTSNIAEPVTAALIDAHLAGTQTIGLYLLKDDSACAFALWDIDTNERAPVTLLLRALDDLSLDALLTFSGRKGHHITVAFADPVSGSDAYRFARAVWERAGRPEHVECFPKQGAITPTAPYGNLVKLPLGVHKATGARCTLLSREYIPLIEGTEVDELSGLRRVPAAMVRTIAAESPEPVFQNERGNAGVTSSGFVHVPYPCFSDLSTARYGQGERDTLLFTLSKHLRQQGQPQAFAEMVVGVQGDRCTPPFPDAATKVENVYRNGYSSFGCEDPAMARFCKGAVCPIYQRTHDVSAETPDEDGPAPTEGYVISLEDLVQIGSEAPVYEVTVCGQRVNGITTDEMHSWPRFSKRVMAAVRFIPELPRVKGERPPEIWRMLVNAALETSTLEERPADAATGAEVVQTALDYLANGVDVSEERADILKGAVIDDADSAGQVWRYFVAKHLLTAIRPRIGPVSQRELYDGLRGSGVGGVNLRFNGRQTWVWRIPRERLPIAEDANARPFG